ncbi:glycerophosphoryl diester phosphodiesterase membrane domain-containing protein, partial [Nocardiopsis rhodophaea]
MGAVLLVALLLFLIGLGWTVLLTVVLIAAAVLGFAADQPLVALAVFLVGLAAVAALAVWVWVRTSLAMPVAVLERLGPGQSLARSWRLTRGSWWRVFGILLLSALVAALVSGILSTPFSLVGMVAAITAPGAAWVYVVGGTTSFVGTVIAGALTVPFVVGVTTLLYVDLRMRREGLDLRLQAAAQSGQMVDASIYLPDPASAGGAYPGPYPGP